MTLIVYQVFLQFAWFVLVNQKENINRGTQQLFSVKYLFGEENIAQNFLWLEDGQKVLDDHVFMYNFRS